MAVLSKQHPARHAPRPLFGLVQPGLPWQRLSKLLIPVYLICIALVFGFTFWLHHLFSTGFRSPLAYAVSSWLARLSITPSAADMLFVPLGVMLLGLVLMAAVSFVRMRPRFFLSELLVLSIAVVLAFVVINSPDQATRQHFPYPRFEYMAVTYGLGALSWQLVGLYALHCRPQFPAMVRHLVIGLMPVVSIYLPALWTAPALAWIMVAGWQSRVPQPNLRALFLRKTKSVPLAAVTQPGQITAA